MDTDRTPLHLTELISSVEIQKKVKEIGEKITKEFFGEELTAICILKGSSIYFADLIREINLDICCEFLSISHYDDEPLLSGESRITLDLTETLENKNVLLVKDIIDTGRTIKYLEKNILSRMPKKLITTALLLKPAALKIQCQLDYVGFEIENRFVVGYGLAYHGHYWNLPHIAQSSDFN